MTQTAIFETTHPHTYQLDFLRRSGASLDECKSAIRAVLAMRTEFPGIVLCFGADLWAELTPSAGPDGLRGFDELTSPTGHSAPSTQGDLFIWLYHLEFDPLFDCALAVEKALRAAFELSRESRGFSRKEARDLTGFIDGSANPVGEEVREVALVPAGQAGAGGSFVITQEWTHDLDKFGALTMADQEKVFGRTKPDSIEFDSADMPDNSHVGRTDAEHDGVDQKLFRQSMPIGTVHDHGLFFLAFSCELSRFDIILHRMFGLSDDGIQDRLLDFSTAKAGSYWFAPSESDLSELVG